VITIREGDYEDVRASVARTSGSGTWTGTSPERRILDSNRALVAGCDWAACAWDGTESEISALFDSRVAALAAPGIYYVQLRLVLGTERKSVEVTVSVVEVGP
jgi:hypothetical protein